MTLNVPGFTFYRPPELLQESDWPRVELGLVFPNKGDAYGNIIVERNPRNPESVVLSHSSLLVRMNKDRGISPPLSHNDLFWMMVDKNISFGPVRVARNFRWGYIIPGITGIVDRLKEDELSIIERAEKNGSCCHKLKLVKDGEKVVDAYCEKRSGIIADYLRNNGSAYTSHNPTEISRILFASFLSFCSYSSRYCGNSVWSYRRKVLQNEKRRMMRQDDFSQMSVEA